MERIHNIPLAPYSDLDRDPRPARLIRRQQEVRELIQGEERWLRLSILWCVQFTHIPLEAISQTRFFQIVGGQGTGKTSLLRLLLDTADISPTATPEQRAAVDNFIHGSPERTQDIKTACVEICESRYDRVLLTVVDTPGLDFRENRELNLEWQVSSILKYVDQQYADTLSEVSVNERSGLCDRTCPNLTVRLGSKSYSTVQRRPAYPPVSNIWSESRCDPLTGVIPVACI